MVLTTYEISLLNSLHYFCCFRALVERVDGEESKGSTGSSEGGEQEEWKY